MTFRLLIHWKKTRMHFRILLWLTPDDFVWQSGVFAPDSVKHPFFFLIDRAKLGSYRVNGRLVNFSSVYFHIFLLDCLYLSLYCSFRGHPFMKKKKPTRFC